MYTYGVPFGFILCRWVSHVNSDDSDQSTALRCTWLRWLVRVFAVNHLTMCCWVTHVNSYDSDQSTMYKTWLEAHACMGWSVFAVYMFCLHKLRKLWRLWPDYTFGWKWRCQLIIFLLLTYMFIVLLAQQDRL